LDFWNALTIEAMHQLPRNLKNLLIEPEITNEHLAIIKKKYPALQNLGLTRSNLTNEGLEFLPKNLRCLWFSANIFSAEHLNNESLKIIRQQCPNLQSLNFESDHINEIGLRFLPQSLRSFRFASVKSDIVTNRGLARILLNCPKLQTIYLDGHFCHITPEAYQFMRARGIEIENEKSAQESIEREFQTILENPVQVPQSTTSCRRDEAFDFGKEEDLFLEEHKLSDSLDLSSEIDRESLERLGLYMEELVNNRNEELRIIEALLARVNHRHQIAVPPFQAQSTRIPSIASRAITALRNLLANSRLLARRLCPRSVTPSHRD
jgi:hypothetical protein